MPRKRQECSAPCATCPFIKTNFGKPNPEGYDPTRASAEHGRTFHDWYTEKNMRRLWVGGIAHGEPMICHATDPNAHEYGGKKVEPGKERLCVGALSVVAQHLKFYESLLSEDPTRKPSDIMRLYRAAAGKHPIKRDGLIGWAWMFGLGRTGFMGGLPLPKALTGKTGETCGVPWRDGIVNRELQ